MKIDNLGTPQFRRTTRTVLILLIAAICIWRIEAQVYGYIKDFELYNDTPILIIITTAVILILELCATYQVFYKPFLAFMTLVAVAGIHLVIFPVINLIAVSSGTHLASKYWLNFMLTSSEHILIALLAFVLWRFSRNATT